MSGTIRFFALIIVVFLLLYDLNSASALTFPPSNIFGAFPSIKPFPFPSNTPKPTGTPAPTATPSPTPASTVLEILKVDPTSANFMQEFTLTGNNFGVSPGSVSFRYYTQSFSSGGAAIVSWSDHQIKAKVPAVKKGTYYLQVITSGSKKSNEIRFSIKNGQPIIGSTSLTLYKGVYDLVFQGTELGSKGSVDIYLGTDLAGNGIIKSWTSSRIHFGIPNLPNHEYGFQITTADGRKSSFKFFTVGN